METLDNIDCEQHQQQIIDWEITRFGAFLLELFIAQKITKEQMIECLAIDWKKIEEIFTHNEDNNDT